MSGHPENLEAVDSNRRKLMVAAAAASLAGAGLNLVELAMAKTSSEAASKLVRWGLLIDTQKCGSGCDACVSACNAEHNLEDLGRPETDAQWIRKLDLVDQQTSHVDSLPMLCQHCEHPPCVDVCPTGASFRRDDGIVLVDKHTCIGCRYCMIACPYKARSFVHENLANQRSWSPRGKGIVEGCTFCTHRVDVGRTPACVEACHVEGGGAMTFGDMMNPDTEISLSLKSEPSRQIREDLKLNTGVRYQNV
ncbi:MAG: 4Fe-4S dicluster domain-containing protein [Gammaproteobacteria bacterium]|nr:4Fe-4S dicluster domain-containing protein [Gammaproteobacteria bacterium]